MSATGIKYCPGTLAEGFRTYSPACLRNMFDGRKVSHMLPFESLQHNEEVLAMCMENIKHTSISGVQQKLSLTQEKNALRLTPKNEQGTHILKPIPSLLKKAGMVPANEHLTVLAGKTKDIFGENYKYEFSYEELGLLIQKNVPAWKAEIEKYFSLTLFNFLFSNGDAHLKNFSLLETSAGDYVLSPAY